MVPLEFENVYKSTLSHRCLDSDSKIIRLLFTIN